MVFSPGEVRVDERTLPESRFSAAGDADSIGRPRDNSVPSVLGGMESGSSPDSSEFERDDESVSSTLLDGVSPDQNMPNTERSQADSNLANSPGLDRSGNRSERLPEPLAEEMVSVSSPVALESDELLSGRATALETGWSISRGSESIWISFCRTSDSD